jgi:hypothetical protein
LQTIIDKLKNVNGPRTNLLKPVRDICSIEHKIVAMRTSPAAARALTVIDATYIGLELPFGMKFVQNRYLKRSQLYKILELQAVQAN